MSIQRSVNVAQLLAAIRSVLPGDLSPVLLHAPTFRGREWEYVKDCIDTGWVSSAGEYVTRFERMVAEFTGARHAIAMVNGTAALHIALLLAGVGRDDEVLMPSLTFVATANAVSYCGAVPHFCDVSQQTLGLDPQKLDRHLDEVAQREDGRLMNKQTGRRIAAVVPMHTFGHPVDLGGLREVAERWKLPIVEDAAESLGSYYRDQHTGTFGLLGVLSFNGNKIITTGGGGMVLTNDETLAKRARHLSTTAKKPHAYKFVHDEVGYNYRMPNINAALGCAQVGQLGDMIAGKRALATRYAAALGDLAGVTFFLEAPDARSNYWLNALILDDPDEAMRDALLGAINDAGIQSRPVWTPMHQLPMYRSCPQMELEHTENLALRMINVPSSAHLQQLT